MEGFMLSTTVDITNTGVRNKQVADPDWLLKRNQQRNFDTLLQVINLRAQPLNINLYGPQSAIPVNELYHPEEMRQMDMRVWTVHFEIDHTGALGDHGELLLQDLNGVPIVPNLTENVVSFPPTFMTKGIFKNVTLFAFGM